MAGQSTAMTKHRAQLVEDASCKPDTRKPMVDTVSPLMDYSALRPSTSFTNISKIDKGHSKTVQIHMRHPVHHYN